MNLKNKSSYAFFLGTMSGHLIEWYDYGIFGFLAVYMAKEFFSNQPPIIGLMSSFLLFSISFVFRPLGGIFFGPLADKIGRKKILVTVIALMSVSTFLPGILPGSNHIGIIAPIILVLTRCIQGFSAGGEIGTITSYVAEKSPKNRLGRSTSWLMVTAVLGLMIGAGVVNLLTEFLGEKIMSDWGWRIPFLLSLPTGLVSIYIRNRFEENTTHLREAQILSRPPLREVFLWKRSLIFIALITPLNASLFYLVMIYSPTWLSQFLKVNHSVTFHYTMFSYLIAIAGMLTGAVITDRIGRRFFLIFVSIFSMINIAMFFSPYVMTHIKFLLISLLSLSLLFGLYTSSLYALMSELLPTHVRATGLALAYNIPVAIFGGSTPLIATWLVKVTGNMSAPGVFFVFTGIISTVGLCFIRRRDYIGIDTI